MRPDLRETLLRLTGAERALILDLYQCRFVQGDQLRELCELSGCSGESLMTGGFSRALEVEGTVIHWLTRKGERVAIEMSGLMPSPGRAYAALRLKHELLRASLYIALRRRGMPAAAYRCEPRLTYRSAAGLGSRTLVPDALVEGESRTCLIEVDRGTESSAQLRHKWLRYREWLLDQRDPFQLFVLAPHPAAALQETARSASLPLALHADPAQLAKAIWLEGGAEGA